MLAALAPHASHSGTNAAFALRTRPPARPSCVWVSSLARALRWLLACLVVVVVGLASPLSRAADDPVPWRDLDAEGQPRVHLYFFYTPTCPHCRQAQPVVRDLQRRHDWLVVHPHDVSSDPQARALYLQVADSLGEEARAVPGFAFCQTLVQGFPGEQELERRLHACRGDPETVGPMSTGEVPSVHIPLLGEVDPQRWSLPVTTVVLGGLDAFNPCAFFVLLFLLSLLVRAGSRTRMVAISGVFVLFSGLLYFVFMAAWLNVFLLFGELRWVTAGAGVVAVVMSVFNIKDFVAPSQGPSLSIPDSAKPTLFARMRRLVRATSWPSAMLGTVVLATAANTYELLCTAGFPMIYTRILTLADLPVSAYYGYLALYNVVYILPLVAIVAIFIKTLGSRKLQEHEGRALKLLSGTMMLGLGTALLVAPRALSDVSFAAGLLLAAGLVTGIGMLIDRKRRVGADTPRPGP